MSNKKKHINLSPSDKFSCNKHRVKDSFELKQICTSMDNKYYWVEENYMRKL